MEEMETEGIEPIQGAQGANRTAGSRKIAAKAGGKSFAAALGRAVATSSASPKEAPLIPVYATPPTYLARNNDGMANAAPLDLAPMDSNADPRQSMPINDDPMNAIRLRLQSGYYNNPKISDALSEKLSGYFDGIA